MDVKTFPNFWKDRVLPPRGSGSFTSNPQEMEPLFAHEICKAIREALSRAPKQEGMLDVLRRL